METISLRSPVLPPQPSLGKSRHWKIGPKQPSNTVFAARRDANDWAYCGRLVDENMIILRMRIHEMKMVERNFEPPSEWMDWEKRYYVNYDSDICEGVGLLQSLLMNMRPCLSLGMVALVVLSVPASTAMFAFHLMEMIKAILSGIILN